MCFSNYLSLTVHWICGAHKEQKEGEGQDPRRHFDQRSNWLTGWLIGCKYTTWRMFGYLWVSAERSGGGGDVSRCICVCVVYECMCFVVLLISHLRPSSNSSEPSVQLQTTSIFLRNILTHTHTHTHTHTVSSDTGSRSVWKRCTVWWVMHVLHRHEKKTFTDQITLNFHFACWHQWLNSATLLLFTTSLEEFLTSVMERLIEKIYFYMCHHFS